MSANIINSWSHRPGHHCASTALSDVMNYYQSPLSEAMCIGLGSAPASYYLKIPGTSPSRIFHTRSPHLEKNFFHSLNIPFEWKTDPAPHAVSETEKSLLNQSIPIMLRVDLKYLKYYNTSTSFSGHVVLMWGYDDEAEQVFLSDTHFEGLQTVPYDDIRQARYSSALPFPLSGEWCGIRVDYSKLRLEEAILRALRAGCGQNLSGGGDFAGVAGIRLLADELPQWSEASDWQWCLRFAYQIIEKRGTGGGAFRKLYAGFFEEACEFCPAVSDPSFARKMHEIAALWTEASNLLKAASEKNTPPDLTDISETFRKIADEEEAFYKRILEKL
ncbi:MAG: BtrH N-terminal domain-containing protein [bacterium]